MHEIFVSINLQFVKTQPHMTIALINIYSKYLKSSISFNIVHNHALGGCPLWYPYV